MGAPQSTVVAGTEPRQEAWRSKAQVIPIYRYERTKGFTAGAGTEPSEERQRRVEAE